MIKHRLYYAIHSIADQFKSFKSNGISFSVAIRIQSYLLHRHQQFDSYALTYISTSLIQFFLVFIFRHSFMNTRVDIQIKQNWFARFADANPNLYLQIREIYPGKFLHMIVLVTFHSFPVSFLFKTHVTLTQFLLQTLISGMYRNHGYVFSETVQWCGDDRYCRKLKSSLFANQMLIKCKRLQNPVQQTFCCHTIFSSFSTCSLPHTLTLVLAFYLFLSVVSCSTNT